eukprot:TRINITY_DN6686_c2_g1_i1.p1 TRINITY_DN6686_c2_g1~~TRINITY_DN6686_c2_g1_i1.p1  ORF type:complete len:642 (+),score=159.14 TRINITY_DN6686_c2_g1_i1:73-1998(+)
MSAQGGRPPPPGRRKVAPTAERDLERDRVVPRRGPVPLRRGDGPTTVEVVVRRGGSAAAAQPAAPDGPPAATPPAPHSGGGARSPGAATVRPEPPGCERERLRHCRHGQIQPRAAAEPTAVVLGCAAHSPHSPPGRAPPSLSPASTGAPQAAAAGSPVGLVSERRQLRRLAHPPQQAWGSPTARSPRRPHVAADAAEQCSVGFFAGSPARIRGSPPPPRPSPSPPPDPGPAPPPPSPAEDVARSQVASPQRGARIAAARLLAATWSYALLRAAEELVCTEQRTRLTTAAAADASGGRLQALHELGRELLRAAEALSADADRDWRALRWSAESTSARMRVTEGAEGALRALAAEEAAAYAALTQQCAARGRWLAELQRRQASERSAAAAAESAARAAVAADCAEKAEPVAARMRAGAALLNAAAAVAAALAEASENLCSAGEAAGRLLRELGATSQGDPGNSRTLHHCHALLQLCEDAQREARGELLAAERCLQGQERSRRSTLVATPHTPEAPSPGAAQRGHSPTPASRGPSPPPGSRLHSPPPGSPLTSEHSPTFSATGTLSSHDTAACRAIIAAGVGALTLQLCLELLGAPERSEAQRYWRKQMRAFHPDKMPHATTEQHQQAKSQREVLDMVRKKLNF